MPLNNSAHSTMAGHSKAELLERLKQGNITQGWGAIVAFDRARINQILQKQYLANFNDLSFLVPFNRSFFTDANELEEIQLDQMILGEPRLSFESASLGDSQVTLTMNIVSGGYTSTSHVPARPPLVRESFNIREDMGYQVRMTVDLAVVQGAVDERGRVSLDVSTGRDISCDLGSSEYSQRRIGDEIKRYLEGHPAYRKVFVLGMVDYNDYSPLAPRSFQLRTQAAPGGVDIQSANYGQGALVVFIQLTSNPEEGTLPVNDLSFPYLIPNDLENGQARYSASVVVEKRLIPFADADELNVLKHLLFLGGYTFPESEDRYTPHDLVEFGNISLTSDAKIVEPGGVALKGGQETRFKVVSGTGGAPAPTRWSVSSLDSPLSVGFMAANGTYRPLAPALMGRNQQVSVVTAHYADGQGEQSYSARVVEYYQSLAVAPRICTWGVGMAPVNLKASSLGDNPLDWKLVGDPQGELTVIDSHNAVFSPLHQTGQPVRIQTIEVTDRVTGESTRAAVIIIVAPQNLRILPYHVPTVTASSTIQFNVANLDDPNKASWEVYGEGRISQSGVFTPPSRSETPVSVVLGETSDDSWGYAIVQLIERQQDAPRWKELEGFAIEALDGNQCYTNGMQQIPLRITIDTKSVDVDGHSVDIPLSDVELSTLKLVDRVSGAEVPFIDAHQEGIEGNELPWGVNVLRNRFKLHSSGAVKEYEPVPSPVFKNSRERYREVYVQSTYEGTREFYAQFQADDNTVWSSIKESWPNSTIQLRGVVPPTPKRSVGPDGHYDFTRQRAFNGVGEELPDDPFSYLLDSIDYWQFGYQRQGLYPVGMSTLKVLGNATTLQYESEQLEELFGSYTGYGFYPKPFGRNDNPPAGLVFDAYFKALCLAKGYKGPSSSFVEQYRPSPGQLIVSLHRVADMPFWDDSMAADPLMRFRERLDGPVRFELRDEEGNRHRFDVSFDIPSSEDSRNRLVLNFQ